jgi:VanZ family protein
MKPSRKSLPARRLAALTLLAATAAFAALLMIESVGAPAAAGFEAPPHFDKLLHAAAHAILSGACFAGLYLFGKPSMPRLRAWLAASASLLFSTLLGVIVELLQAGPGAAHGRQFDPLDIVANMAGAVAALALGLLLTRRSA